MPNDIIFAITGPTPEVTRFWKDTYWPRPASHPLILVLDLDQPWEPEQGADVFLGCPFGKEDLGTQSLLRQWVEEGQTQSVFPQPSISISLCAAVARMTHGRIRSDSRWKRMADTPFCWRITDPHHHPRNRSQLSIAATPPPA